MITLIGMGAGTPGFLTAEGKAALRCADLILGAKRLLAQLPEDCLCVDLASTPGIDLAAAERRGMPQVWARSLPGRLVPRAAAEIIRDTVYHILEERGDLV